MLLTCGQTFPKILVSGKDLICKEASLALAHSDVSALSPVDFAREVQRSLLYLPSELQTLLNQQRKLAAFGLQQKQISILLLRSDTCWAPKRKN